MSRRRFVPVLEPLEPRLLGSPLETATMDDALNRRQMLRQTAAALVAGPTALAALPAAVAVPPDSPALVFPSVSDLHLRIEAMIAAWQERQTDSAIRAARINSRILQRAFLRECGAHGEFATWESYVGRNGLPHETAITLIYESPAGWTAGESFSCEHRDLSAWSHGDLEPLVVHTLCWLATAGYTYETICPFTVSHRVGQDTVLLTRHSSFFARQWLEQPRC